MKIKKKIACIYIAIITLLASSVPTFASEEMVTVAEYTFTVDESDINSATVRAADPKVSGTIQPNTTFVCFPTLSSYIGFNKTFNVVTTSTSTSGAVYVHLYKGEKELSDDWIMGVDDVASWSFFLPSSGEYTLKIQAYATNANVDFYAWWS